MSIRATCALGMVMLFTTIGCKTDELPARSDATAGAGENSSSSADSTDVEPPNDAEADSNEGDASASDSAASSPDAASTCTSPNCVAERFRTPLERDCDTSGEARPARCGADPVTFDDWGPASAVSRIEFQSERARNCCFNMDGSPDGSVDNAFGELVAGLPIDLDRQIQANLAAGTFVALGEYQGLESLDRPETLEGINVYLGLFGSRRSTNYVRKADASCRFTDSACRLETTPGQRFLVNPTILDEGTHPEVHFSDPTLSGSTLKAGPAELVGHFNVPGLGRHSLRVRGATFEATVDLEASSVDDGLVIEKSRIGGYVLVRDVLDLLNGLVGHCECLGSPERAVTYPQQGADDDPDYTTPACEAGTGTDEGCRVQCKASLLTRNRCSQISNVVCRRFSEFCLLFDTLADRADLDTDGDGQLDALSFGAIYEMTGARIRGVANYLQADDRRLTESGTLSIERVFTNRDGWLAAFAPSEDGLELLDHARIEPGNHRRTTLDLSELSTSRSIQLVPYADDGPQPGTFEPNEDGQLQLYPKGRRVTKQIRVTPR